jgi:hypothetical protein
MSTSGVPVEEIARLAGHASTRTTEVVYRRELRPVLTTGAEVMDTIFNRQTPRASNRIMAERARQRRREENYRFCMIAALPTRIFMH